MRLRRIIRRGDMLRVAIPALAELPRYPPELWPVALCCASAGAAQSARPIAKKIAFFIVFDSLGEVCPGGVDLHLQTPLRSQRSQTDIWSRPARLPAMLAPRSAFGSWLAAPAARL